MSTSLYVMHQLVSQNDPTTSKPDERLWTFSEGVHCGVVRWLRAMNINPETEGGTVGNLVDFNEPWIDQMGKINGLLQRTIGLMKEGYDDPRGGDYQVFAVIAQVLAQALVYMAEVEVSEITGLVDRKNYVDIRWS